MNNGLPDERMFVVYWLPDVGIGPPDKMKHVHVPLTDALKYTKGDGSPQTDVVILFNAEFSSASGPPYLTIPQAIMAEQSNVQLLRSNGVKVLLSVTGKNGVGWHSLPADQHQAFAIWVRDELLGRFGLDGIDLDDEYSEAPEDPASLMRLVATLRGINPSAIITKPLFVDMDYFKEPVPADNPYHPGAYLSELLDFGCTMEYGRDDLGLVNYSTSYFWIFVNVNGVQRDVGLGRHICIGVQAGPADSNGMTKIEDVKKVADWLGYNGFYAAPRVMGMMLFTFSQDIQQFTFAPQNDPGHMFPNTDDHEWQMVIEFGLWSRPDVKSPSVAKAASFRR